MKKTFLFLMLVTLTCLTSIAQPAITEGFYRVQNQASKRYLYVRDCTGDIDTGGADMGAIELWLGQENTISDPSCVMYFKSQGGAWDIQSQGTGIYQMTGHVMSISTFNGGYVVSNSGQYLYDITRNSTSPKGRLGAKTDKEMSGYTSYKKWDVLPISISTDQYFGFKPTISAGGSYYTSFYADFAFTPTSANTKVWYVSKIDKQNKIAVIKQVTGKVSRKQPLIIQSNSNQPASNKVDLANSGGTTAPGNMLTGVLFSNGNRSYIEHPGTPAYVEFDSKTMRVLGKNASGKLAFINNPSDLAVEKAYFEDDDDWYDVDVIPHNTAYLKVDADCPASLQVMTEDEYNAALGVYTLTYMLDGEFYKQVSLKAGATITPEPAPAAKTGYTFSGWQNEPTVMPASNVTVTGTFTANVHKLTYKVDGQLYKSYDVAYGTTITAEPAPTKPGHTFSGWSTIPATMPDNDVEVNGSFTAIMYNLNYVVDGQPYKTVQVACGATITPEAAPTKTGHTFSGWKNLPTVMPASDVTVTGSFTVNQYTLTYKVDGAVYKTYTYNYGATITPEPAPTKTGYTFSGWDNVPSTMPAKDVVVNGTFTVNKYKLIYKVDGKDYKTYDVAYGAAITAEAAPTKEGHTFSGWSEIPQTMPAHDVTVTGTFTVNSYTLTYKVDGAVYKTYTLNYGATITPEAAPTKTGYTFSGWSNLPTTMPANDVTVTGSFTVNQYTLTYKVDGSVYKTYTLNYGEAITPETAPTKTGHTFSGWSEIPETMPDHDVTVTGSFTVNQYTLTYKVDGNVYKTYTLNYGATITPEAAPTKTGYTFSGWSTIPATMPANDVEVTGSFKINSYKLTYMVDGEVYKTYTLNYGSAITPEAAPTKTGYTFSGWSEIPETMPANDVTVTGTFSVNSYKLTYYVDGEVYKTFTLNYGVTITPETAPVHEGETFSGWSEIPETMPAHDVDVYGSFNTNTYILTYKVDGVVYKTFSLAFGTPITPIDEPTREGHTFSGWGEIPETMPAHNVEVNGTFSANSYTLTYMVDGVEYKKYTVNYGVTITPETAPVREGYTFSGWSGLPTVMPAQDVVVTGSFSINSYKLTYYVDGVEYKTFTLTYGTAITPIDEPTLEGHTFSGWSTIPTTMPARDVNVYGSFSAVKYTLTYMVDGEVYKTYSYSYGQTIEPESAPVREGYTFSGWSGLPSVMPAEDVTVTGSFTINHYTITYLYNGEQVHTVTLAYDEEIPEYSYVPESTIETEYTFVEWLEDGEVFTLTRMPARNVVLSANVESKPTGIDSLTQSTSSVIFDLQGRRVKNMQRGQMYIVNGRKFLYK